MMLQALRQPPPLVAAFGVALALHILLLFGIALPAVDHEIQSRLRVTLSTAPSQSRETAATLAAADQAGEDRESRLDRSRAPLPTGASDAPATADPRNPGDGNSDRVPVISRRPAPEGTAARSGGERQRGGSIDNREDGQAERLSTRPATADERAAYLESWRREIEQMGSRYFPAAVMDQGEQARLTMQVSLAADGRLTGMRILRSSGRPALDRAAEQILRKAAPFTPFPAALRQRLRELTFAYDWRFVAGSDSLITVDQP